MTLARSAIDRLLRRPLVIHQRGDPWTDAYGVTHPGAWVPTPTLGYVEQTTTKDVTVGGQVVSADWLLLVGPGTSITAWDRVEVPDMNGLFEVIGLPSRQHRATSDAEHHIEARLRLINTGATTDGQDNVRAQPAVPGRDPGGDAEDS